MGQPTILIVEDEPDIADIIDYNLRREGYLTIVEGTGEAALAAASRSPPDLVILDLMLPGVGGLEVCRRLKRDSATSEVPVVMVTARAQESDVVAGLEIGADDYVTKPFSPRVLVARVRSVLRRTKRGAFGTVPERIETHELVIDVPRHEVRCSGEPVSLSATEFQLLALLATNPGRVFTRSQIIAGVKGDDYPVTERSVDVQVVGLRRKLGTSGDLVETVRGVGYRMRDDSREPPA
jgi:two-component system, OmpR family, alkaline phosphatase synthesis response regulator PhoP